MSSFNARAQEFLGQERIAVAGVSRNPQQTANAIYGKLRDSGHQVFAVNPKADEINGEVCYHSVADIPGGVDGVVIVTNPTVTEQVVRDCASANVPRVWMHNNTFMPSSVSEDAVAYCREHGIEVIDGGCPMMFLEFGHKCMRLVLGAMGRLPKAG